MIFRNVFYEGVNDYPNGFGYPNQELGREVNEYCYYCFQ